MTDEIYDKRLKRIEIGVTLLLGLAVAEHSGQLQDKAVFAEFVRQIHNYANRGKGGEETL